MSNLGVHAQILAQAGTATPAMTGYSPSPRLINAAHEFEAAMMKEMLAPLEPGHDALDGGDDEGSSSALNSFAGEALGKALSEHGGFGIADSIIRQLSAGSNHSGNSTVPLRKSGTTLNSSFQ
jgi:flagellar protein FlgJ